MARASERLKQLKDAPFARPYCRCSVSGQERDDAFDHLLEKIDEPLRRSLKKAR